MAPPDETRPLPDTDPLIRGGAPPVDRRDFLRAGAGAAAFGLLAPLASVGAASAAVEPPRVRRLPTLGRTGLQVSDIGFGGSRLSGDPDLVRHAFDRGITYFDTAESYTGGDSEIAMGKALKGIRDQVILGSKTKMSSGERWPSIMESLEGSLKRLQTDRIDIFFNHAVNDLGRMDNPEWGEFNERARQAGKIRFVGMSGHGGRLVECIDRAVERNLVDVMLVGFNFGQDPAFFQRLTRNFDFVAVQPELPRALAAAREAGIGVIAMKTLRGARLNDMRPFEAGGATFSQAAFRWVFSTEYVDSLIVTMKSPEQVDEYLGASGWTRNRLPDAALLRRYELLAGAEQCRYGCDACLSQCPVGVPISDVLRARMYAEDYGDPELGRESYAALGASAGACLGCAVESCAGACPHGLAIPELTRRAHRTLSG